MMASGLGAASSRKCSNPEVDDGRLRNGLRLVAGYHRARRHPWRDRHLHQAARRRRRRERLIARLERDRRAGAASARARRCRSESRCDLGLRVCTARRAPAR